MRDTWRRVPLGAIAVLDIDRIDVDPLRSYPIAGVFNAGKGLFARGHIDGSETNYPVLHRLHRGQLVMRKLTAWEGPITTVDEEHDGYLVSPEFPTFTLDRDAIDPSYMRLICQTPALWEAMKDTSTGSVQRRKRVSPSALLSIDLDLPPLAEQHRIVDLVEAVDNASDGFEAVSAGAWDVARALMSEHELSVAGKTVTLSSLLAYTVGGVWGSEPGADEADVRVVRSTEFRNDGRLDLAGGVIRSITARQLESRRLLPGDILLEKSGGGPKQPVGRVVFVESPSRPMVCANFVQLVRPDPARVSPLYLFFRMWNWHSTGQTLEYQSQTTGIRNLRTKDYLQRSLVVPPIDEQETFLSLVLATVGVAHTATASATASSNVRSSLLTELLSGEHEIPSSYDALLESA